MKIPGVSDDANIKVAYVFVKLRDLPRDLNDWMGVNPRRPIIRQWYEGAAFPDDEYVIGGVGPEIITTLKTHPHLFSLVNRGITILVDSFKESVSTGGQHRVHLFLTDRELHGISDGGHTLKSCYHAQIATDLAIKAGEPLPFDLDLAYIPVRIIAGIPTELVTPITEGLNSSQQVDQKSMDELNKRFEPLKAAMKKQTGENEIRFYSGHPGLVKVEDICGIIENQNRWRFFGTGSVVKGQSLQPRGLYRFASKALAMYNEDAFPEDRESRSGKTQKSFGELLRLTPDFLKLNDMMQHDLPELYNAAGGRFAYLVNHMAKGRSRLLPFTGSTTTYQDLYKGLVLPMLSGFRANIRVTATTAEWIIDPLVVYQNVIQSMVQSIVNKNRQNSRKFDIGAYGLDPDSYQTHFDKVESVVVKLGGTPMTALPQI